MHLKTRNVNTAFRELVMTFHRAPGVRKEIVHDFTDDGKPYNPRLVEYPLVVRQPSRNGNVLKIDEPVTISYSHPRERVLFNAARDANPFLHLYHSLWMLAGRNDVAPLAYYCSRMREFSDDGRTLNGAYGYRWRHSHTRRRETDPLGTELELEHDRPGAFLVRRVDQLDLLVAHLKADPTSRRAVLQMWNVEDDLLRVGKLPPPGLPPRSCYVPDQDKGSKDVCCNLSVMFSLREHDITRMQNAGKTIGGTFRPLLDMTVTNRSNDLVWGLLGTDYVDFTFLQEYVAARLGAEVGIYHHFTNNLHVYDWNWKPDEWLADGSFDDYAVGMPTKTVLLVRNPDVFERELPVFVEAYSDPDNFGGNDGGPFKTWQEPFLETVAAPMLTAFMSWKRRAATTLTWVERVAADDWRIAARNWLDRRLNKVK